MFRPIRVDHTNCLQVAIKTHSFQNKGIYAPPIHWVGLGTGTPKAKVVVYYESRKRELKI